MEYVILTILILFVASFTGKQTYLYTASGLLIAINLAFLILWKENLHCTQWTSFSIAFFDFVRHSEAIPTPKVYQPFIGTVIRLVYGLVLLGICFLPVILILKNIKNFILKQLAIPIIVLGVIATIAVFIPKNIIGERISAIVEIAGLLGYYGLS